MSVPRALPPVVLALGLYLLWTGATYLLEGRIQTLLRPEAVADRITYLVVANLLIGIGGALFVARRLALRSLASLERIGFRTARYAAVAVPLGTAIGLLMYAYPSAPSWDLIVMLNGFAQVLPVTVAEVLVCWAVVGVVVEATVPGRAMGLATGVLASSVLFGVYHYAHSPPFNTTSMVLLLAAVGLATGVFFFASRDVYGTVAFHNFLAMAGVLQAMGEMDALQGFAQPQPHLLGMAALSVGLLVLLHRFGLRPLAACR